MGRKGRSRRRVKQAAETAKRLAAEALEAERERAFDTVLRNQRYGEFKPSDDDMPGTGKTWHWKKEISVAECQTCIKPFTDDLPPCETACLCAPIMCGDCMDLHVVKNGWKCIKDSSHAHLNCPTCRKKLTVNNIYFFE